MKSKELTSKQVREIRNGEISDCSHCYSLTKTILKRNKLICGKCKGLK